MHGEIVNVTYNKGNKSLVGINGTKLRSMTTIQLSEINKDIKPEYSESNHARAKKYLVEQKKNGLNTLQFRLLSNDKVELVRINPNYEGKVIIPSFVIGIRFDAKVNPLDRLTYSVRNYIKTGRFKNLPADKMLNFQGFGEYCKSGGKIDTIVGNMVASGKVLGPSAKCHYKEILVDNKSNDKFDASGLCLGNLM